MITVVEVLASSFQFISEYMTTVKEQLDKASAEKTKKKEVASIGKNLSKRRSFGIQPALALNHDDIVVGLGSDIPEIEDNRSERKGRWWVLRRKGI